MKRICLIVAFFALLSPAWSDQFYLTNSAGEKLGPFDYKEGATLVVGEKAYTIVKVVTRDQEIVERMKTIIIPEIEFRQANIHDVVEFLVKASIAEDSGQKDPRKKGVNTIYIPETAAVARTNGPAADPFLAHLRGSLPAPDITFSAHYISLYDTLNVICKAANLRWSVQNGMVLVEPP
jgi:hypothetical protein